MTLLGKLLEAVRTLSFIVILLLICTVAPTSHRGFIFVEDPEAYGLNSVKPDNDRDMYGVSMLHQLHCLVKS